MLLAGLLSRDYACCGRGTKAEWLPAETRGLHPKKWRSLPPDQTSLPPDRPGVCTLGYMYLELSPLALPHPCGHTTISSAFRCFGIYFSFLRKRHPKNCPLQPILSAHALPPQTHPRPSRREDWTVSIDAARRGERFDLSSSPIGHTFSQKHRPPPCSVQAAYFTLRDRLSARAPRRCKD